MDDNADDIKGILKNYNVYHENRESKIKVTGGGVLIAVHSDLDSKEIKIDNIDQDYERVFVRVIKQSCKFLVSTAYFPPQSDVSFYVDYISTIEDLALSNSGYNIVLAGDFNFPEIEWREDNNNILNFHSSSLTTKNTLNNLAYLVNSFKKYDLIQKNSQKNISNNVLDLVFSNSQTTVNLANEAISKIDIHHPVLDIEVSVNTVNTNKIEYLKLDYYKYDFLHADYDKITESLNKVNWLVEIGDLDCITATNKFYKILGDIVELNVEKKHVVRDNFPFWFSGKLKSLVIKKKQAHTKYKKTNCQQAFNDFKEYRRLSKIEVNICFSKYIQKVERMLVENPTYFWTYIKDDRKDIPKYMTYDEVTSSDCKTSAELFANYFSDVYRSFEGSEVDVNFDVNDLIDTEVKITLIEIVQNINEVKNNFSKSADGLSVDFLKKTNHAIAKPLFYLFNKSIAEGIVHPVWKTVNITPAHKNLDKTDVKNYRPISIINPISKVIDSIMSKKIKVLFADKLSVHQHGFTEGRSVVTNLSIFANEISDAIKEGCQLDVVYTDFRKAFDLVNPKILINKLASYNFPRVIVLWLMDYLSGRRGRVKVNKIFSEWFDIICGVPQGSHIGPILFSIFINDLPAVLSLAIPLLFADDLKLFLKIKSLLDCINLQKDIDRLYQWCEVNLIGLNFSKCNIISFHRIRNRINFDYNINNNNLTRVEIIKDLGVFFDSGFTFDEHVNRVLSKANRRWCTIMRKCRDFKNPQSIKVLYFSLVRSCITYASTIWQPLYSNAINRFEKLQHKCIRRLAYLSGEPMHRFDHDYAHNSKKFQVPTVESVFNYNNLIFMYKVMTIPNCNFIVQKYLPIATTKYSLRNPDFFDIGKISRNYELKNPFLRCMQDYNALCCIDQTFAEFGHLAESAKVKIKKHTFEYK